MNVNDGIVCASVKQERDGLSIWLALEPNQAGLQIKWDGEGAVLLGESGNDKQKKKRAMNVHGNLPTVTPLT